MQRYVDMAKVVALLSVVCVAAFACLLMVQASSALKHLDATVASVGTDVTLTLSHVDEAVDEARTTTLGAGLLIAGTQEHLDDVLDASAQAAGKVSATLDRVNASCVPGPCGVLSDVNKTLNTARGTMGRVEVGVDHWDHNLAALDEQENALFGALNTSVAAATPLEGAIRKLVLDVDALALNPDVPAAVREFAAGLVSLDAMLATANEVETRAMRGYLHPSRNPWVRTYHAVQPWLLPMAQVGGAVALH